MKVKKLKQILQEALDSVEDANDEDKICMVSNTFFLGHSAYFMGVSGTDGGYFNLQDIQLLEHDEGDNQ